MHVAIYLTVCIDTCMINDKRTRDIRDIWNISYKNRFSQFILFVRVCSNVSDIKDRKISCFNKTINTKTFVKIF